MKKGCECEEYVRKLREIAQGAEKAFIDKYDREIEGEYRWEMTGLFQISESNRQ
jgi:hypothetical protein